MTTVLELAQQTTVMAVTGRRMGADGVVLLTLTDPAGHDLPGWAPGAHIALILPDIGLIRHYSLCGSPDNPFGCRSTPIRHSDGLSGWRIGVLRQPNGRGGSAYVYDALRAGTRVEVRGPRNNFPLVDAERYLFVAGGIGITPILPMIEAATADGRPWELLYGGRSRSSMAFLDELSGYGDRVRVHARDEAGALPLASVLAEPRPDTLVYCCGPEPLLGAVEDWCAGWPAGALHTERFAARRAAPASGTFDVVCHRAGRTLTVPPGRSILEVAEAAGVVPLSACREGVCGTCETRVLEGDPEHRDSVLTTDEKEAGKSMMICVSRSTSARLVLDL